MKTSNCYEHLEPWPGSHYRQLFIKGRKVRAEMIYRQTVGEEPRTPEEVARDYQIPLEAVQEAIHYCEHNEPLLRLERERDRQITRDMGLDKPPFVPPDYQTEPGGGASWR